MSLSDPRLETERANQRDSDAPLLDSLRVAVPVLWQIFVDRWCVIGSAAARLTGAAVDAADIDLLCTRRDAEALVAHWEAWRDRNYVPAASDRFRSHFARFELAALPVEVMGDLELCMDGTWRRVQVDHLVECDIDGLRVPIPTVEEQLRLLEAFGRPKDRARMALLNPLAAGDTASRYS